MSRYWDDYLIHGGPGSGRYPKGSGERPRAMRGTGGIFKKRAAKKKAEAKAKADVEAKKRKEKESIDKMDAATLSSNIRKAKQSGDVKQIKLYQDHMTNQDLRDALDRIDLNKKLSQIGNVDKGKEAYNKLKTAAEWTTKVEELVTAGAKGYNAALNIQQMMKTKKPAYTLSGGSAKKKPARTPQVNANIR